MKLTHKQEVELYNECRARKSWRRFDEYLYYDLRFPKLFHAYGIMQQGAVRCLNMELFFRVGDHGCNYTFMTATTDGKVVELGDPNSSGKVGVAFCQRCDSGTYVQRYTDWYEDRGSSRTREYLPRILRGETIIVPNDPYDHE